MNISDFEKRVKRLLDRECALTRKEALIAKTSAKYNDGLAKIKFTYYNQWKEWRALNRRVEKINLKNDKLKQLLKDEESRLQDTKKSVALLEDELEKRTALQVERHRSSKEQMDRLRCLKESTNIFINVHKLPDVIQGAIVYEESNKSRLIPLCIDPQQHTQEEVQDLIWGKPECFNGKFDGGEWNKLLFITQNSGTDEMKMEVNTQGA